MTKRRRRVGIVPAQALVLAALRTRESQGARIRIRTRERRKGKASSYMTWILNIHVEKDIPQLGKQ